MSRIREAVPEDLPQLIALAAGDDGGTWDATVLTREFALPYAHFTVLADEGRALGFVDCWLVAEELEVQNIVVAPDQRRMGYGGELLAHALRQGRALGAQRALLEVREGNTAARALYRRAGFLEVGRRRGYYVRQHEDALLLTLEW